MKSMILALLVAMLGFNGYAQTDEKNRIIKTNLSMKLKTLLILVLITLPGIFNSFKAQFVYSNEYNNFIMAAYNEEIFDRQYYDLESRLITYDLSEKLMFLSSFSPCAVRSKIDTLYYKNDTISQELIIRKIDDRRIYFALSSQKIHQKQKEKCEGYASISDYIDLASKPTSLDGAFYAVIEYWCKDFPLSMSIKISHNYTSRHLIRKRTVFTVYLSSKERKIYKMKNIGLYCYNSM